MAEPLPAERLAQIRERTVLAAQACMRDRETPINQAEADREDLLAEVDRLRESLVGVLRKVLEDQTPSYMAGLVPADVLGEALSGGETNA